MPHPALRYPAAWHALEEATERAWLDDWIRGRICAAHHDRSSRVRRATLAAARSR